MRSLLPLLLLLAAGCVVARSRHYGEPLADEPALSYAVVSRAPAEHVGKDVLVTARVTAVCLSSGCWMQIEDDGATALVRWQTGCGGRYSFPPDAVGKRVLIQGAFHPKEVTPDEVEHLSLEAGFDVAVPAQTWEFNASAVVIYD